LFKLVQGQGAALLPAHDDMQLAHLPPSGFQFLYQHGALALQGTDQLPQERYLYGCGGSF
jgi:hypothetical protein